MNETPQLPKPALNQIQIICDSGAGFNTKTTLTDKEIENEIDAKGGTGRTGYAVFPVREGEVLRVYRQRIIGYLVTVLEIKRPSGIVIPNDKQVLEIGAKQ